MSEIKKEGAVEGENPAIDPNVDLTQLSDEQKAELKAKADQEIADTLEKLKGLRAEKNRVNEKVKEGESEFNQRFRGEQLQKAKAKFIADFNLSDDERASVEESFSKIDSGAIDADLIYSDFKKAFALSNVDSLIEAKKRKEELEKNAADFMGESIGGTDVKPVEGKTYSPEAYDYIKQARKEGISLSLEEAEKYVKQGNKRTY
jgi:hypothetical protein